MPFDLFQADEYEKLLKRMHEGWIKDADPPIIRGYAAHVILIII